MRSLKWSALVLALLSAACPPANGGGEADGGGNNGTRDGGGPLPGPSFDIAVLDANAPGRLFLAVAARGSKIGIAYYVDIGNSRFEIRYVERGGTPSVVATGLQKVYGLSLALDLNGNPLVAYLGKDAQTASEPQSGWYESDLAVTQGNGSSWTTNIATRLSNEAVSNVVFNDTGTVVGLFPSIAVKPDGSLFIAYRDVHYGQFPTDWKKSDLETVEGAVGSWSTRQVAALGGSWEGAGGLNSAAIGANDEPAVAWSAYAGNAGNGSPVAVYFARRSNGTTWAATKVHNSAGTNSGPSLAYDARVGYALAYEDQGQGITYYQESVDGQTWKTAEPMYTSPTGGWYPSVAFTADGNPAMAWYDCSVESGVQLCPAADDALVLAVRSEGMWPSNPWLVDDAGAYWPRLTYLGGKAVIAYKDVQAKTIKLAVEK
jgi:hypothetical protein